MSNLIRSPLALLLALFLLLGGIYSVVSPIFESGDEVWHYPFVQWLATGHGLPVQDPAHHELWEQEGGQPPLYYALAAATTFWVDTGDMRDRLWRNPYARIGITLAYGNKNLVVHTSAEDFPWHNTTLAVHLIRFLSLLLAAGTVVLTYLLAREFADGYLPLAAAALVAFNPMFLFISASVNNDNLATFLATLGLLLTVQLVTRRPTRGRLLLLGVVIGLAALTKVSDAALAPLAGLVVARLAWRRRDLLFLVSAGLLLALPVVLLAGWWYVRNYLLYGDPLAFNVWVQIAGGRPPITLLGLIDEFQGFRISYWGNFGGVNLIAADWVYRVLDVFSMAALVGLVVGVLRRRLPAVLLIPAIWLAIILISLIRWTLLTYASQGRLIFPAIAAVALLLALGLDSLLEPIRGRVNLLLRGPRAAWWPAHLFNPASLLGVFLFAFAIAAPFRIIAPAYAPPLLLAADAPVPNPVHITFASEGQPELAGFELGRAARPGQELPVTLYWRASAPVNEDLYVYVHLYDRDGNSAGQWDALPGNGLYPTSFWQPGQMIVDRYRVPVVFVGEGPQVGRVEVGLARVGSKLPLKAQDPSGHEITPSIGQFKISASQPAASASAPLFRLGDSFELLQFGVVGTRGSMQFEVVPPRPGAVNTPLKGGDVLEVNFTLRASQTPKDNDTIFVHLVDPNGQVVAQQDEPPQRGSFPTSFWDTGDEVSDQFTLTVPANARPGDYQIEFGLYRAGDNLRLPVSGAPSADLQPAGDHLILAPLPLTP